MVNIYIIDLGRVSTEQHRVLHRKNGWTYRGSKRWPFFNELKGAEQGRLVLLIFLIDLQCVIRLNKNGFLIICKFGHTTLRPKSTKLKGVLPGSTP